MAWYEGLSLILVSLTLILSLVYVFYVAEREHKEKIKKDNEIIETLKAIRKYLEKE